MSKRGKFESKQDASSEQAEGARRQKERRQYDAASLADINEKLAIVGNLDLASETAEAYQQHAGDQRLLGGDSIALQGKIDALPYSAAEAVQMYQQMTGPNFRVVGARAEKAHKDALDGLRGVIKAHADLKQLKKTLEAMRAVADEGKVNEVREDIDSGKAVALTFEQVLAAQPPEVQKQMRAEQAERKKASAIRKKRRAQEREMKPVSGFSEELEEGKLEVARDKARKVDQDFANRPDVDKNIHQLSPEDRARLDATVKKQELADSGDWRATAVAETNRKANEAIEKGKLEQTLKRDIQNLEYQLSQLGLFKRKEKKALKAQIARKQSELESL